MFGIVIFLVLEHLSTAWIHWAVAACGLWSALRARIKIIIICSIMMTVRVHSAMYVGSRIRWRANWLMNDPDDNASSLCQALADWRLCRDANQKLTVCLAHRQTKLGAPTGHISRAISKMYAVLLFRLRQRVPVWLCETHHMFGSTCVAALLLLLLLFYSASIMDSVLLAGLPHDYLRMVESKNRSSLVANNSALSRCFRWQRYPSKPRNVNQLLQTCLCAVCCLHAHAIEHCKWAIPVAQRTYLCICSKSSGSNIRLGCAIGRHHCRRLRQMQLRPRVPT